MRTLSELLKKLGVASYQDLNVEEKLTYMSWEESLSGRKLTDEDVAVFLDTQLEDTLAKIVSTKLTDKEDTFLKMKLEFIRSIKIFLDSPQVEKAIIEKSIEQIV